MMMCDTQNYWTSGICPSSGIPKNTTPLSPRTETDPVSETFCSLKYRKMKKVQKHCNPERKPSIQNKNSSSNKNCDKANSNNTKKKFNNV
jgi:hypothetical protein